MIGGPEVADVVGAIVRGDVPVDRRRTRAAELFALSGGQIDAAMAYYVDFTDEIDTEFARRAALAGRDGRVVATTARAAGKLKLVLDEMHAPTVAQALMDEGWDVVVASEKDLWGRADSDLMEYASGTGRVIVTENVEDFSRLAADWLAEGRTPFRG